MLKLFIIYNRKDIQLLKGGIFTLPGCTSQLQYKSYTLSAIQRQL